MVPPLTDLQHLRTQAKKVMVYPRILRRQADISQTFQSFPLHASIKRIELFRKTAITLALPDDRRRALDALLIH